MDPLMVLMMEILSNYCLETHWGIMMVKYLVTMNSSNWDYLFIK